MPHGSPRSQRPPQRSITTSVLAWYREAALLARISQLVDELAHVAGELRLAIGVEPAERLMRRAVEAPKHAAEVDK